MMATLKSKGGRNSLSCHVVKSRMAAFTAGPGRTSVMMVMALQFRDGDGERLPDFVAAAFHKVIKEILGSNKKYQMVFMAFSSLHGNKYNQSIFLSVSEIRSTEVCKFMEIKLHHPKIWEDHDSLELHKKNHGGGDHGTIEVSYAEAVSPELMQPPQRSRRGFRPVESDTPGRVSDDIGDPPGQQSMYIPPGDICNEMYRLSTFEHFPVACPISRKSLAQSGFYFTGFFDRVKCFSCGRTVERWEARDNPVELRWHKPDCQFPRGDPCGNIPINDLFNRLHTNPMIRQQQAQRQQEQVLTQTDPNTGAVIRTVRYPADLPERIRRTGGTFEIGPGNSVIIQSGPGSRRNPAVHIGNEAAPMPPRRWRMANVVSDDHKRYLNNLYLNRELDRLASFARWPVSRPNVDPAALARTGFFYLGDLDRTQCFSCGGVLRTWTLEDDAQEEHRTHFTSCAVVQGTENRNVAIPEQPELPEDRNRRYPCGYPANPHMRSEAARLETFDHRWPAGRVEATPASIAQAGFFFLGERDRVKCWYCNGGLQNWEYDDMPWIEHAKWFPNCQFLLQNQGQVFVYRHLAMNPHLARPIIAKQEGATVDPAGGEVARGQDIPPGGPNVRQPSPPPTIIDPQEEIRKKKLGIDNVLKTSDVCKNVITMGFSVDVVRRLIEEGIDAKNVDPENVYTSTSALLDDVMKKEEEMQREAEEEEARNQASLTSSVHSGDTFEIGPGNSVITQSGPGSRPNPAIHIGNEALSDDHRRYLNNSYLNRELDSPGKHQPSFRAASLAPCPGRDVSSDKELDDEQLDGTDSPGSTSISSASSGEEISSDGEDACVQMMIDPVSISLACDDFEISPGNSMTSHNGLGSGPDPAIPITNESMTNVDLADNTTGLNREPDRLMSLPRQQVPLLSEGLDVIDPQVHHLEEGVDPENVYTSTSAFLGDIMKKEEEMKRKAEEEMQREARNQASLTSFMQPGYERYDVSFYDDDEPMDDEELYGSATSSSSVTTATQVQQKDDSQESLQEQLQKLEEERMCKICFSNTADMVFIPCCHMICCMDCTQAIRQCPVCRTKIEKAIKTYSN